MKTRYASVAGLAAIVVLLAGSVALGAQQGDPQARARLRERISDLYLIRLTRALDLTDEQTARIYPLLTKVEKDKAALQGRMGLDLRDLREELAKTPPGDEAVLGLVGRIRQARRAIRQKDEEVEAALEGILTPVQRARYLIFTVDFLRSVGVNLDRVRGGRVPLKRTP
jgi:Spy/CpxP family protein refolding chaperone